MLHPCVSVRGVVAEGGMDVTMLALGEAPSGYKR